MEKTEDVKWVISRIDELFQDQVQVIEYEIKNSEEFREREVKRFKDTEKGIVSFMVILSSLVFGFNQIGVVGVNYVGLIALIFVGGGIVYLITGIFTVLNKKIFDEIHNNLVNGTTQLYGLKSYYLHQTILLENSKEEFEGFANYLVKIASSSLHIPVYYKYQECLQSLRIFIVSLPAKRQIESSRNILKSILDDASVYYKNNKNIFESNSLLKDKLYFGTDLLTYQENPIKKKAELAEMQPHAHPKIANITTACIVFLIVFFGVIGVMYGYGEFNTPVEFYPPNMQDTYSLTMYNYTTINGTTSIEKTNFPQKMTMSVILKTSTLSAQNPITVTAQLKSFENIPEDAWKEFPNTLVFIFPEALNDPIEFTESGIPNSAFVKVYKYDDEKIYQGSGIIKYQFESKGGFFVIDPYKMDGKKTHNDDGTITLDLTLVGDLQDKIEPPSRFPVEPVSVTQNLHMNNIGQAISFILADIGLIQSRKPLIKGISWLYEKILLKI